MDKIEFETTKLYYGLPVFLLGYKDQTWGYNYTSSSSSYTLGDTLMIGLSNRGNAQKQILMHEHFTFNLPNQNLMKQIEIGGFSNVDKFAQNHSPSYTISEITDAPIINECMLTLECTVIDSIDIRGFVTIFARINRRLIDKSLLENNHLRYAKINPVIFLGDEKNRVYRYLSEEYNYSGDFS